MNYSTTDFRETIGTPSPSPQIFSEEERQGVYRAVYSRRDIRHFRSQPIPDQILASIIRAAHHGPSVGFMQPWDFIVIKDLSVRQQVKEHSTGNDRQLPASLMNLKGLIICR